MASKRTLSDPRQDPDYITQEMLSDAVEATGYDDLDEDRVREALHEFDSMSAADLTRRLRSAETKFDRAGGRGVALAEEIDQMRIAIAARRRQPHYGNRHHGAALPKKRSSRSSRRSRPSRHGNATHARPRPPGYVSWGTAVHKLKWLTPKILSAKSRGETVCGLTVPSPAKVGQIGYYDDYPETHAHFCRRCRSKLRA